MSIQPEFVIIDDFFMRDNQKIKKFKHSDLNIPEKKLIRLKKKDFM